jgi:hypothetical protein
MIVGGLPVNTAITGQQIIDGAGGGGAVGYYAQYQDDISQPLGAVNVGQPVKFRTMDFSNGVTVNADTEITIANTGIYNLQFSFQFQNVDSQEHDVTVWLRKNGSDVAGSAGFVAVVSSHGGIPGHCIPSWNYLLDAVGGDYYELYWSATSLDVSMHFYPAGSPPPSAASAIFTVTQQAGIIAGTGMTALNGLSADVQTISTGTTGSDFNVVSSGTDHQFNLPTASATNRGALSTTDWSAFNGKQAALVSGTNIKTINGSSILGSGDLTVGGSGLTVGTTAITSGTIGRVLFEGTGNVLQQDASFFWDNTNKRLGVGATPSTAVRLDVRAQGALSTDIAFRVRNSADTLNLFAVNGDSSWISRNNSNSNQYIYWNGTNRLELKNDASGEAFISNNHNGLGLSGATGLRLSTGNKGIYIYNSGNFYIGNASGIQAGSGQGNILFANNTGPTTNVVDHHYYYSADIVAGNAAPHFRTENGAIIKLYQQTTAVAASTFVQNSGVTIQSTSTFDGYTLSQIVKALRNTGILA